MGRVGETEKDDTTLLSRWKRYETRGGDDIIWCITFSPSAARHDTTRHAGSSSSSSSSSIVLFSSLFLSMCLASLVFLLSSSIFTCIQQQQQQQHLLLLRHPIVDSTNRSTDCIENRVETSNKSSAAAQLGTCELSQPSASRRAIDDITISVLASAGGREPRDMNLVNIISTIDRVDCSPSRPQHAAQLRVDPISP